MSGSLSAETLMQQSCTSIGNHLELRLMMLSATKNMQQTEAASKISTLSSEMSHQTSLLKDALGEDYTSDEYKAYLSERESVENDYQLQINAVQSQMERSEENIDLQIESIQTRLEYVESLEEQMDEAAKDTAEKMGAYFQ